MIGSIADGITRSVENVNDAVSAALFEPVIRLGVTGLARSGKTVFITSFVANLLDRGRMPQLRAAAEGRIEAAYLQPQPDDTIPRFDYETHLGALKSAAPSWPESTRAVSELRLSLRVRPSGMFAGISGPRTIHIDIVDYPGEWLLDLGLLDKTFTQWSEENLTRLRTRAQAQDFLSAAKAATGTTDWNEMQAQSLATAYTEYLHAARNAGFCDVTPGRFLLPGELAGSPVLTFAPLSPEEKPPRRGLWREMERRFEAYKARVVKPFFRDHFARIDRQVVLVDVLDAIHNGPQSLEDLRRAMADTLAAFRPGKNVFLSQMFLGRRVERLLFAATKADHLHHKQHGHLNAVMQALMRDARDRASFAGAQTQAMAIAALRATTEETLTHDGRMLDCVRGRLLETGRRAAFYPGELPEDPAKLLHPAREGAASWLGQDYGIMRFAPARLSLKPGEGPPHIRLDRAAEFLIGDRL